MTSYTFTHVWFPSRKTPVFLLPVILWKSHFSILCEIQCYVFINQSFVSFRASTLFIAWQEGIRPVRSCTSKLPNILWESSLHFNSHFPGGPGSVGTRMSPFWILLELRMLEVVATTGAIRRAKLQSNHHHQQTNIQFFTGQMPFLSRRPNNSVKALKENWESWGKSLES